MILRINPIASAGQAETYYAKSDGGYYEKPDELRCEWLGRGAELLGLEGPPDYEQFKHLIHGLDPWAVEHAETRPVKADNMPDPHRHIHLVFFNLTFDKKEKEWTAVKFRPIMDLRKYLDRRFNQRLSHKLAELGYRVETKWKTDERGN